MAGKGSEIGRSFEELAAIYDGVKYNDKLRICFDTCHVNDAGYDIVNDFEGVMEQFDKKLGKDQIAVFTSMTVRTAWAPGKTAHANIGERHHRLRYLKAYRPPPGFSGHSRDPGNALPP